LGAGITVFFILVIVAKAGLLLASLLAAIPIVLALGYTYGLRQGRPPGYDRDMVERLFAGDGFGPDPASSTPERPPSP
jgi:hypothetical protein